MIYHNIRSSSLTYSCHLTVLPYFKQVVLGGELERPIHHSELIYDVTLKWSTWAEGDRRNTYLLLKRNTFFEEAVPEAVPPISIFGEAYYGSPSSRSVRAQTFNVDIQEAVPKYPFSGKKCTLSGRV